MVARQAHDLKVIGSNPISALKKIFAVIVKIVLTI